VRGAGVLQMSVPSGVLSFLFTDIEGSTRRWESDAVAMRSALAAHDQALRAAIEAHGGAQFKHTGDGVCAAFASPKAAVDAAVAAQAVLELPVRMGIATGEAHLREADYFGPVLNRAARVMACGHGGQILLDGQTAGLVSGVDVVGLGSRRLRDLSHPVELFQVRHPRLRSDFPPLKTIDPAPGNLRPATSSFVGRERDLAAVATALKRHRLVTLTGVGGVGKTRLAVEVAARAATDFPDGVWLIELAAVGDPDAVPEAVAAVLGIKQQPGMSVAESVAAALAGRARLLLFDNCEHVLDAAADLVTAILVRSATVKILATSREGLRVADEQPWPVASLEMQSGIHSAAARLFTDRAATVAPGTSFGAADECDAIVDICRRLDGIPLAIELAASRMMSMTAAEVRNRIGDRFRLLVGSRRGLERHQTLRHAVQWSYDLLDEAEKSLLTKCSVFAGGFDHAGACAIDPSGDDFAILDLLDSLVRKSLLLVDRSGGRTRFAMLETIRQFAEEQLAASGHGDETRTAQARYFAAREADVFALWDSPNQWEAYAWFTSELANLRAAFRWASDTHDLDSAAAIAIYAPVLGYWVEQYEPVAWAEELIEPAEAVEHQRLAQLYVMAAQCYLTGRVDDFLRYVDAGEEAVESGRFADVPAALQATVGGGYLTGVPPVQCLQWCHKVIARTPDSFSWMGPVLVFALTFADAHDEAIAVSEELLANADTISNPTLVAGALLSYGYTHSKVEPTAAYDALRRGMEIAQHSGGRQMESVLALNLSSLAAGYDDPADAFMFLALAIQTYYESGSFQFVSGPIGVLAALLDRLGHYESAATISGFASAAVAQATWAEINAAIAHLREVLGDAAYESCAGAGAAMSNADRATYALDQIARAQSAGGR
jgi:predicted ATPase/class 3 adenylate cyclase